MPSADLRELEVHANSAFDTYRELYFEGGVSSVYCWDLDDGFAAVVLIKKGISQARRSSVSFFDLTCTCTHDIRRITRTVADDAKKMEGSWDSIHVLEVHEQAGGRQAKYVLTSTVMLYMLTARPVAGNINLSGSMTRQVWR